MKCIQAISMHIMMDLAIQAISMHVVMDLAIVSEPFHVADTICPGIKLCLGTGNLEVLFPQTLDHPNATLLALLRQLTLTFFVSSAFLMPAVQECHAPPATVLKLRLFEAAAYTIKCCITPHARVLRLST